MEINIKFRPYDKCVLNNKSKIHLNKTKIASNNKFKIDSNNILIV